MPLSQFRRKFKHRMFSLFSNSFSAWMARLPAWAVAIGLQGNAVAENETTAAENAPRPIYIREYRVTGSQSLPPVEVQEAVYPFLGPGRSREDVEQARVALEKAYQNEPFVHVVKKGVLPQTQNVRGSNYVQIGVIADRIKNRAIVISTLDNLVKGSAGQAIQNMNLMFGFPETAGLEQIALFP